MRRSHVGRRDGSWLKSARQAQPLVPVGGGVGRQRAGERFLGTAGVSFDVQEGEILGIIGKNGAERAPCSNCSPYHYTHGGLPA